MQLLRDNEILKEWGVGEGEGEGEGEGGRENLSLSCSIPLAANQLKLPATQTSELARFTMGEFGCE